MTGWWNAVGPRCFYPVISLFCLTLLPIGVFTKHFGLEARMGQLLKLQDGGRND
jgi:hypothetical protein